MDTRNVRMFVLGGGEPSVNEYTESLFRQAYEEFTAGMIQPNVVLIPTARNYDQAAHDRAVTWMGKFFDTAENPVKTSWRSLHDFKTPPALHEAAFYLGQADVIYIPGGDTVTMLRLWREWGLLEFILAAIERGVLVMGLSAGLIAWFMGMDTDADHYGLDEGVPWKYRLDDGLGIYPIWCCPHASDNAKQYTFNDDYAPDETRGENFEDLMTSTTGYQLSIAVAGETGLDIRGNFARVVGKGVVTYQDWYDGHLRVTAICHPGINGRPGPNLIPLDGHSDLI